MKTQKNKPNYKKALASLFIILVCSILFYGVVAKYKSFWPFLTINSENTLKDLDSDSINYNPPTKEEIVEGQEAKARIINTSDENLKKVSVGIAFADVVEENLEIRAFVSGVIEGGGICTAILKKDETLIKESSTAFIDFKTSQCQPIYIPIDKFKIRGSWSLAIYYKSETSNGESETIEIKI